MRMPFCPAFTERPRFFHVQNPATLVAEGICRAISKHVPERIVIVKAAHGGEVVGEGFGVSGLQLLNQAA